MTQEKKLKATAEISLEMSISEDDLISGLVHSRDHSVEIIAFGITYTGVLKEINVEHAYVVIQDGDDDATLEFERIESFRLLDT